jgi:DNA-directed RNA polymerase subunit D
MKITVLEKSASKASFLVSGAGATGTAVVNAARRAIIGQLESFAVDQVTIYENNSALYDEYIAARIGLVPLSWEEDVSDDAKIALTLAAEGPCTVYSRDLKSTDEKIKPFFENIPIAVLGLDQKLRLEAVAVKGTAKKHAKFQCAHAAYANLCKLTPAKKVDDELVIHDYPAREAGLSVEDFAKKHQELCNYNLEYVRVGEDEFKVETVDDAFIFSVESYNNVPAEQQFYRGVALVKSRLEALAKELK